MRLYRFYESLALLAAFWRRRRISLSCSAPGSLPMQLLELVMIDTFWTLQSGAILAAHSSNRRKNMKLKMSALALLLALTAMLAPSTLAHTIEESCIPCDAVTSLEATELSTQLVNLVYDRTINLRVDIDHQDENGNTALILAAENNREDVVQLMLNSAEPYPNANAANNDGKTSLMWAAEHGNTVMIGYLLDDSLNNKASVNIINESDSDKTALDYVFDGDGEHFATFKNLLNNGAAISLMANENKELLEMVYFLPDGLFADFFQALVNAKGDASEINPQIASKGLGHAVLLNNERLTRILIEDEVNCRVADDTGKYPNDYAIENNHNDLFYYLHDLGCEDSRDPCPDNASHDGLTTNCICDTEFVNIGTDAEPNCVLPCEADEIRNDNGECEACGHRKIPDEAGESCMECDVNQITNTGGDQCVTCPQYRVPHPNANKCMACPPDRDYRAFQNNAEHSECICNASQNFTVYSGSHAEANLKCWIPDRGIIESLQY